MRRRAMMWLLQGAALAGATALAACGGKSHSQAGGAGAGGMPTTNGTGSGAGSSGMGGAAGTSDGGTGSGGGGSSGTGGAAGTSDGGNGGLANSCPALPTAPATSGNVIHLAPSGSDVTGDGSAAKPFATLERASKNAQAGDAIELADGTYQVASSQHLSLIGTAAAPIVIRPAPGAHPVLDGASSNITPYQGLIDLYAFSYLYITGIRVTNSPGAGINSTGANNGGDHLWIIGCEVDHAQDGGLTTTATGYVVAGSHVHDNALRNKNNTMYPKGGWAAAMSSWVHDTSVKAANLQYLGNDVHDNWGEGVIALQADHVTIEGNKFHDNFSVEVYIDRGTNVDVTRNLIYQTTDEYNKPSGRPAGVTLGVESCCGPDTHDDTILVANNVIVGTRVGVSYWADTTATAAEEYYKNLHVLFNVIQPIAGGEAMEFAAPPTVAPTGCFFVGNVAYTGASVADPNGWTFGYNDWVDGVPKVDTSSTAFSKPPGFTAPDVANTGAAGFALQAGSPLVGAAPGSVTMMTGFAVPVDYLCNPRGASQTNVGPIGP